MTIEAGVVITKLDCLWHVPPGRSGVSIPDSPDLWEQLWKNRAILEGFAHSHPGAGVAACNPSLTDVTTFDAIERALGKTLKWWICSFDCMVEYQRVPGLLAYKDIQAWGRGCRMPLWVHTLREISGHYVRMFECTGCKAPCEFDSREPMLGWGCEGGSVVPGDWNSKREFKTVAKTCVFCDPHDDYKKTGRLPPGADPSRYELHKALDEISKSDAIRMVSAYYIDECTVWDPHQELWVESDEHLRNRLT